MYYFKAFFLKLFSKSLLEINLSEEGVVEIVFSGVVESWLCTEGNFNVGSDISNFSF